MERLEQRNFFDNIPEAKTDTPEDRLREAVGHYLDLGALRSLDVPVTELHRAFRYEPERMPEEIKKMVAVLEVLLTPGSQEQIKSPRDLEKYFRLKIGPRMQEEFWVMSLGTKNNVMGLDMIYRGTVNSSSVRILEVLRRPMYLNATAFAVLRNHPSDSVEPSPEYILVTRQICEAGKLMDCELLDSLIVAQSNCVSLRARGLGFDKL